MTNKQKIIIVIGFVFLVVWNIILMIDTKRNNNWIKEAQPTLQQVKEAVLGPGGGTSDVPPAPGSIP